jgi:hypothetical protein
VDHYERLGVAPNAGDAEIRRAFLAAARVHHPDLHATDAPADRARHASRMQELNAAWAVLGDATRRADYDRDRVLGRGASSASGRSGSGTGAGTGAGGTRPVTTPPGKGWTPRPDDTGWQQDFAAWAAEDDRLADDVPGPRRPRPAAAGGGVIRILPVALFAAALLAGFIGLAVDSRGLLAAAFVGVAASATLFVILPLIVMSRSRTHR